MLSPVLSEFLASGVVSYTVLLADASFPLDVSSTPKEGPRAVRILSMYACVSVKALIFWVVLLSLVGIAVVVVVCMALDISTSYGVVDALPRID